MDNKKSDQKDLKDYFKDFFKQKQEKKEIRQAKPLRLFKFLTLILIIAYLLLKVSQLNFGKEVSMSANLFYEGKSDIFYISYDIEDLNNPMGIKEGQKVCIPYSFTSNDDALIAAEDNCAFGTVLSTKSGRAVIKYKGLTNVVSRTEFLGYYDEKSLKPGTNVTEVVVTFKLMWKTDYQIIKISQK